LPDTRVAEAEIDATLERLREQTADFIDVPERAAEKGDFVVIDLKERLRGNRSAKSRRRRARICTAGKILASYLAAEQFSTEILRADRRSKTGGDADGIVDLSADFLAKELAGSRPVTR